MTRVGHHPAHRHEHGMTMIELVVSMAIMVVLVASLSAAVSIGYQVLGSGGTGARVLAATDVSAVQSAAATDVGRAACIVTPNVAGGPYGACTKTNATQSDCVSAVAAVPFLCVGWPDLTSATCRVAVYQYRQATNATPNQIWRLEYSGTTLSSQRHLTGTNDGKDPVTVPTPSVTTVTTPYTSLTWVKSLKITLSSAVTTLKNPPSDTLTMVPLVADPGVAVTGVSTAC